MAFSRLPPLEPPWPGLTGLVSCSLQANVALLTLSTLHFALVEFSSPSVAVSDSLGVLMVAMLSGTMAVAVALSIRDVRLF